MADYYVAFWNLENLFDVENSPRRSDKLQRTLAGELGGWSQAVLDTKIEQLAKIVRKMNSSHGPDLIGVCEVENDYVLGLLKDALQLPNRQYEIAYADCSDGRGIDVAFVFDSAVFEARDTFMHFVVKRVATRELFQVNFVVRGSNPERLLVVIGNHWPSRMGGTYESEPYRIVAGETVGYFHERIREVHGQDTAVLVMGDFNDEPFDRSLVEHALSERTRLRVTRARNPMLWNLMWPLLGKGAASHYYEAEGAMLDQFLVSKGLATGSSGLRALPDTVEVFALPEMVGGGAYGAPRRFGRGDQRDEGGFSDHYPITVTLRG